MWRVTEGQDLPDSAASGGVAVVNRQIARRLGLRVGSALSLRGRCDEAGDALPPVRFIVGGIADFPFDSISAATVAGTLIDVDRLCGESGDQRRDAPGSIVAGDRRPRGRRGDPRATSRSLRRHQRGARRAFQPCGVFLLSPDLHGPGDDHAVLRISPHRRSAHGVGESSPRLHRALRAIGLSRSRVAAGVVWESSLLVGTGGLLAIPIGEALSVWLDAILRTLPGLPAHLHFFVFEPRLLVLYLALLAVASVAAAIYPMRIVSVLPIAATLRREGIS